MERATGTCMYTHVCINTDAPVWMFRLVYIYSYVSQVVHPTLGIKAPPRCTSSFSPFLSAPLTPSFTPFITRPSPALSLSLSPPLFSTSRPSFLCPTRGWIANAADRHWTCIKLSGRSQCQGSSAFLSTDSEGKRPVVCLQERERGKKNEWREEEELRSVDRSTAEFTWRVTGTGRWWDGSMKEDGRITCIVVKMIEPNGTAYRQFDVCLQA